jgi:hypothetical protein
MLTVVEDTRAQEAADGHAAWPESFYELFARVNSRP